MFPRHGRIPMCRPLCHGQSIDRKVCAHTGKRGTYVGMHMLCAIHITTRILFPVAAISGPTR